MLNFENVSGAVSQTSTLGTRATVPIPGPIPTPHSETSVFASVLVAICHSLWSFRDRLQMAIDRVSQCMSANVRAYTLYPVCHM